MAKMKLEWHKRCLKNKRIYYERMLKDANEQLEIAQNGIISTNFYEYQIIEAESSGKDSFDRKRFRVKRNK